MTDRQLRHIDAGTNGDKSLTKYNVLFATDAPLMTRQGKLQTSLGKCSDYHVAQKRNTGYHAKTIEDLQKMEDKAWAIAKITHEYAIDIGNDVLAHAVDFDRTDFSTGSIQQMKDNASIIFNAASGAVVTAMVAAGYHITAIDVAMLGTLITNVGNDMGQPKADIAATKAASAALKNEIDNTLDVVMDSIVDYISPYALTNLFEYNAVVDSFEISEIGKRMIALRVRVSDETTHTRCGHVVVNITGPEIEEGKKVEKKSSKRGIADYSHETLPEGNYTVTVTMHGYQPKVFNNVAVFDNKMTLVDCQLTRI